MVANTKSKELSRTRELEAEIEQLRDELRVANDRLEIERTEAPRGFRRGGDADNIYVFDDEDDARDAFDAFFAAPDPHLDKVRGFLLD